MVPETNGFKEKDTLLEMGINPCSFEGIKYVGNCKRFNLQLEERIPESNTEGN